MKYKNGNFLQLDRKLFSDRYKELSINAKWLYTVLVELEHRFTGEEEDFFFRSNEDLSEDTGMSLPTLKRAKEELRQTDLIEIWQTHWVSKETSKRSKKHITAYRIL